MKKKQLVLDLDNTLICSILPHEKDKLDLINMYHWKNMHNMFMVCERPMLQIFLDYVFQHFNVSIWTAATKSYALYIIDEFIIQQTDRQLNYVFFSKHCEDSKKYSNKPKDLSMLKNVYDLKDYTLEHTIIIDDHPDVFKAQPDYCFPIEPFHIDPYTWNDVELLKMMSTLEQWRR